MDKFVTFFLVFTLNNFFCGDHDVSVSSLVGKDDCKTPVSITNIGTKNIT